MKIATALLKRIERKYGKNIKKIFTSWVKIATALSCTAFHHSSDHNTFTLVSHLTIRMVVMMVVMMVMMMVMLMTMLMVMEIIFKMVTLLVMTLMMRFVMT